ncbi:MAG: hypothetical protein KC503_37215 [Myxococcales bacterium]|nr:hypothetical protein [Myxococcales bacterium]
MPSVNGVVHLKRFTTNSGWTQVGESATGGGVSGTESAGQLVRLGASAGVVHIAFRGARDVAGVRVYSIRHLVLGDAGFASLAADDTISTVDGSEMSGPALAFDGAGVPAVTWSYTPVGGADSQLAVTRYMPVTNRWVEQSALPAQLPPLTAGVAAPRQPALLLGDDGALVLAFSALTSSGQRDIFVRRQTQSGWRAVTGDGAGNVSQTSEDSGWPRITARPGGKLVVGWEQTLATGGSGYYIAREP